MLSKEQLRQARLRAIDGSAMAFPSTRALDSISAVLDVVHRSSGSATPSDMQRWYEESFSFGGPETYFLTQKGGGPCGVKAAVQGELLCNLLYKQQGEGDPLMPSQLPRLDPKDAIELLASALTDILERAAGSSAIHLAQLSSADETTDGVQFREEEVFVLSFESRDKVMSYLSSSSGGYLFQKAGVFLFVLSLVYTKGVANIKSDMDDDFASLIGSFGMCSQELINLLITGVSSGNTFDGDKIMGAGLKVRGVKSKSRIGYLTHLENLSLCRVGTFLKVPQFPVWLIGSSSHFTLVFSREERVNTETASERLLSAAVRAFKSVDNDESGFVSSDKLNDLCELLNLSHVSNDSHALLRLKEHVQIEGNIILWSSFWKAISQLMVGTPLDDVIAGDSASRPRSDSAVARELQDELNNGGGRQRSDSDLAREMQAEWNNDAVIVVEDPVATLKIDNSPTVSVDAAGRVDVLTVPNRKLHRTDSQVDESDGASFLFHYNGLETATRAATLRPFRMYRRSATEIIGVSTALDDGGQAGGISYLCPIEEVLRTRWHGAKFDWLGNAPPSID
jgi:hypothetical protein